MPEIIFIVPDGTEHTVQVTEGLTVMDGSTRANLPGIVAECGGSCSCATCHVHVDPVWADKLPDASDEENELVEFLDGADDTSRLSCQIVVTPELDGLVVRVPENG